MNKDSFEIPIGAGMTGITYASNKYTNLVLKMIHANDCIESEKEFLAGKNIYDAYMKCSLLQESRIKVPFYIEFDLSHSGCSILM